jgi:hypothetical protein
MNYRVIATETHLIVSGTFEAGRYTGNARLTVCEANARGSSVAACTTGIQGQERWIDVLDIVDTAGKRERVVRFTVYIIELQ